MNKAIPYQPESYVRFDYLEAETVAQVCSLLSKYEGTAKVVAGGTDLLLAIKRRKTAPSHVINLRKIPDLNAVSYSGGLLKMGTLTTLDDLENSAVIRNSFPIIFHSARQVGTQQIRNVGTLGGNLCNAAPSADMAPGLIALGAQAKLRGVQGERTLALDQFFLGPGVTALRNDEILVEIQVPTPPENTAGVYLKLPARTAVDLAVAGVAAVVTLDSTRTLIKDAKIVMTAVAPTPLRALAAEKIIQGKRLTDALVEKTAQVAAKDAKPISDVRGSADYRREMILVLTNQAVRLAVGSAQKQPGSGPMENHAGLS